MPGDFDDEAGRTLEERRLELPPGSMVYIDARIFHAVEAKPIDSQQLYRIFVIDIFKEAGPPASLHPTYTTRMDGTCDT